jgi:hypothetical protein
MVSLTDIRTGWRLLRDLPRFLRHPLTIDQAKGVLAARLAERERRLVAVLRTAYNRPGDPYGVLLRHAGCDYDDVIALVHREGVDESLLTLAEAGVWLSCPEFKGRVPVRRGSLELHLRPTDLVSPGAVVHGLSQSSGSRGPPTAVPIDLQFIADHAVNTWLGLHAHDGLHWAHAHWGIPGGTGITNPLEFAKGGAPPQRSFTSVAPAAGFPVRYHLADWTLRFGGFLARVSLPGATPAPLDDPMPLVRWLRTTLDNGVIPHVWTFASSAVLACQAAQEAGIDITGARFTMGGEPTTAARRAAVAATGAVPMPRYGATETDILAFACRMPAGADDMHFLHDRHGLVTTRDGSATGLPNGSLLFTSLLRSAPVRLLNVSLGDTAEVDHDACGCPMAALGWPVRVRNVRSFEKLTVCGIACLDVDVGRILDEVLPRRFGGKPTDYQLIEEAKPNGRAGIKLRADPALGPLDESVVTRVFLDELGAGKGGEHLMALMLELGDAFRVERIPPCHTASGKILHIQTGDD